MATPYLRDRRFGDNHGRSARERFDKHYRHEYPCGPDVCVYCGDPATTDDHVLPISYLARLGDPDLDHPAIRPGLIVVPACWPCNALLKDHVATTVEQKRAELKARLRRKYKRLLGTTEWGQDELDELGPALRRWILWLRYSFMGLPGPAMAPNRPARAPDGGAGPREGRKQGWASLPPRKAQNRLILGPPGTAMPPPELKAARERLGLTQSQFGALLTPPLLGARISLIEHGKKLVDKQMAVRLREAFVLAAVAPAPDWPALAASWPFRQLAFLPAWGLDPVPPTRRSRWC
jgi:hypothetical protein